MFLGQYQQGQWLAAVAPVSDATGAPATPDDLPSYTIRQGATIKASGVSNPLDRAGMTGLFGIVLQLGAALAAGAYQLDWHWTVAGDGFLLTDSFEVLPGGSAAGAVIALAYYERPFAVHLVERTDDGTMLLKRNPSV